MKRRVFMGLAGAAVVLPGCGRGPSLSVWRGVLFGSDVSITVADEAGEGLDWTALSEEMVRLEGLFSLSAPDAPLAELNRDGRLADPPPELVEVTRMAVTLAERSGGVFDPTIQPYWAWLQERLRGGEEPGAAERRERLELVDYRAVRIEDGLLAFERPGMGLTLNALAQGFVTDRMTGALEAAGVAHCLVNLGEFAARGRDADGRRWRVAVRAGGPDGKIVGEVALENEALAVSSGAGYRMTATGEWTHLLSPESGESPEAGRTVAVTAPRAVVADGLATACGLMSEAAGRELVAEFPGARVRWFG